jgi:hypothetical protein
MGTVQEGVVTSRSGSVDRLFDGAKLQVQAGVYASRPWACETMVMAMLLEHQKRVEEMLKRIEGVVGRG